MAVVIGMLLAFQSISYFQYLFSLSSYNTDISTAVEEYDPQIRAEALKNGIMPFTDVIKAMMMQESKGLGTDPMQASESPHNTEYERSPGSIGDPGYSIEVGVRYFADCLSYANCTSPEETDKLMLAIQGYNFGNGYIAWAQENYGGYTEESAIAFSQMMKEELGWQTYGDPEYAQKVMQYYSGSADGNSEVD